MFVTSSSPVQLRNTKELRTFLQQDFLASHSQKPARTEALTTTETCSPNSSELFAQFDRKTSSWRTSQISLLTNTSEPFSENWPRSGMTVDGIAYRRPTVARRINATAFGSLLNDGQMLCKTPSEYDGRTKHPKKDEYRLGHSGTLAQEVTSGFLESVRKWPADTLWPTPTVKGNFNRKGLTKTSGDGLETAVKKRPADELWPTPMAHEVRLGYQRRDTGKKGTQKSLTTEVIDSEGGRSAVTGQLNPDWVDWLMGVPIGHTACEPLVMGKFQSWWQQHGGS